MSDKPVVGIDLGTTNSCVAIWQDGTVRTVLNKWHDFTTPSCVGITDDGYFVGNSAIAHQTTNAANTFFEVKRVIGQQYASVKKDTKFWPFTLVKDEMCKPLYQATVGNDQKLLHPEEISAIVLKHLKTCAESHIKQEVTDAVITVPAYFNESQREATEIAGRIAGLNVLKVLSEPVAAALAFGRLVRGGDDDQNVLVYDLGGGTFDTAVVSISSFGVYHVRSTNGNSRLGGGKFVDVLIRFCIEKLGQTAICNEDIVSIRTACENAKIELSTTNKTNINIGSETITINRDEYEALIAPFVKKTMECVEMAIKDADLEKNDIHHIVLVGGGTFTPLVRQQLSIYFGKVPHFSVNPMEAVAHGACVQAAVLAQKKDAPPIYVRNVTPLTIGLKAASGKLLPIVKRNSSYPVKKSITGKTQKDNQQRGTMEIYEGEHRTIDDNQFLGSATLEGLPESPKGEEKIAIVFQIGEKSEISVTMWHERTKQRVELTIDRPKGLNESKIKVLANNLGRLKEIDKDENMDENTSFRFVTIKNKRMKIEKEGEEDVEEDACPIYGRGQTDDIPSEIELGEN